MLPTQVLDAGSGAGIGLARRGRLRALARDHRAGMVGALILLAFVVLAIGAPWLAPYSTTSASGPVFAPPS
ncbi:MAG: hypothetical protein ACRDZT_01375, partial [Acidimicrobiales bacterium]